MYAQVAVENTAFSFDKLFTYLVPENICVLPGVRVTVPFGGGNKTRVGMVMSVSESFSGKDTALKSIVSALDKEPVLTQELLDLAVWMKSRYFCTYFDCVKLMLPTGLGYKVNYIYTLNTQKTGRREKDFSATQMQILSFMGTAKKEVSAAEFEEALGISEKSPELKELIDEEFLLKSDGIKRKTGDATMKMVRCVLDFQGKLSPKQQYAYDVLCDAGQVSVKELMYFTGSTQAVIKALVDKGGAEMFDEERYRKPKSLSVSLEQERTEISFRLSMEQEKIFDSLVDEFENSKGDVSLLYGVTGSGKTSVFLKLIDYVVGKGKEVILMVPEIALTPQTIEVFKSKFGGNIAVFHSGLSLGERLDEWKRASRGEVKIVIGTRSAVFAPFKNLGLIVIDEEQEHTYKSETAPRYHARDIARFRVNYGKSFCVLSSATPSMESYFLSKKGKYKFNSLNLRFGDAIIPEVRLIDMNQEALFGNTTDISFPLKKALNDNLRDGMQSIVLLNRRGYHTFARCSACHEVVTCPNCSISLTYHSANNRLMCHYCGFSKELDSVCPACGESTVSFSGFGTQRAEESLAQAVPNARILRIDADSVSSKNSLERKLDAFSNGDYDIMVGTQMVAKGLNFENVTLVGVISADQSLYSDDFRSNERTFDLLTQVVGRAGRGKYPGKAIIQTSMPENPYLRLAASQDYFSFYDMEIVYRQAMLYPPFVDIAVVGFVGTDEIKTGKSADYFLKSISEMASDRYKSMPLRILRPSAAAIPKVSGKFRYKLIIKCKNTSELREMLSMAMVDFSKNREYTDITVYTDINPYSIM